jgi:hypothetical protein
VSTTVRGIACSIESKYSLASPNCQESKMTCKMKRNLSMSLANSSRCVRSIAQQQAWQCTRQGVVEHAYSIDVSYRTSYEGTVLHADQVVSSTNSNCQLHTLPARNALYAPLSLSIRGASFSASSGSDSCSSSNSGKSKEESNKRRSALTRRGLYC